VHPDARRHQGGRDAGHRIAGAADRFEGGHAGFIDDRANPGPVGHIVAAPLDEQAFGRIVESIGHGNHFRNPRLHVQNEPAGVKRMGRHLISQKGELADVGREQIVSAGLAAHFGHVHKARIGNEGRGFSHLLNGEEHPVVPIHIRLQVVKDHDVVIGAGDLFGQIGIQLAAAVPLADIAGQIGRGRRLVQHAAGRDGCREQGRRPPVDRKAVPRHADLMTLERGRAHDHRHIRIGYGAYDSEHWRLISS
jgi:hypothetical protein